MNYQNLYDETNQKLQTLNSQKAVLTSKINELVEKLSLDPTKPLPQQVEAKLAELTAKKETMDKELSELINKIETTL